MWRRNELTRGAAALPEEEGDALKRVARFYRPALPLSRVGKDLRAGARMYRNKAHYNVITGKAAFTVDGDFFFNEVKANYSTLL